MGDAYVGAGVERITYKGVLYDLQGRSCGDMPDLNLVEIEAHALSSTSCKSCCNNFLPHGIGDSRCLQNTPVPASSIQMHAIVRDGKRMCFYWIQTACGESQVEVKLTLQGLLEEHVEMLLDAHEVLPEPIFQSLGSSNDWQLLQDADDVQMTSFTVLVPSTADK